MVAEVPLSPPPSPYPLSQVSGLHPSLLTPAPSPLYSPQPFHPNKSLVCLILSWHWLLWVLISHDALGYPTDLLCDLGKSLPSLGLSFPI